MPPYEGSKEFQKLKSLVGKWTGTMKMGDNNVEFAAEYRLVSNGTAIQESLFAGTPKEMITMYHDKSGKLGLTHYCAMGNQPSMILKGSEDKSLVFDFDPSCGIDAAKETHMHALKLTFVDADTLEHDWTLYQEGKPGGMHPFTLKRVKE